MHFTESSLTRTAQYELLRLHGTVADSHPFEAFLFKVQKSLVQFEIRYAHPPQHVSAMARANPSILAGINGGFYKLAHVSRTPLDWLVIHGREIQALRNFSRPCIYVTDTDVVIGAPAKARPFDSVLQAGPLLVQKGDLLHDYSDFQENARDFDTDITADRNPRSVFGYDATHVPGKNISD